MQYVIQGSCGLKFFSYNFSKNSKILSERRSVNDLSIHGLSNRSTFYSNQTRLSFYDAEIQKLNYLKSLAKNYFLPILAKLKQEKTVFLHKNEKKNVKNVCFYGC